MIWITQCRELKIPISEPRIRGKALELTQCFSIEDFKASHGWFQKFARRNCLSLLKISGDSELVDQEVTNNWIFETLNPLLVVYDLADVFNFDEFAFFYQALPVKSYVTHSGQDHTARTMKKRCSVLAGANMLGTEKYPLLVIGESKNPRCFSQKEIPLPYSHNESALMTSIIFEEFFRMWDSDLEESGRKVLVFIDNCSAHPENLEGKLQNIKIVFLPPNTTSVLQPMDQGIIRNIKHFYRSKIVSRMLRFMKEGSNHVPVNLFEAMEFLKSSWEEVTEETIKNCFNKAWKAEANLDSKLLELTAPPGFELLGDVGNFEDFVSFDDSLDFSGIESTADLVNASNFELEQLLEGQENQNSQ
jgi:hypothetical protein